MKIAVILLLALVSLAAAAKNNSCNIEAGSNLIPYSKKPAKLKIKVPCKFNMIHQDCGDYTVTMTPGLMAHYFRYHIDTVWFSAKNIKTGEYFEGRTTNKMTALKIIKGANYTFLEQKNGTITREELFDITNTTHSVTVTEKNGIFSFTLSAYDFTGNKHRDSTLKFVCHVENTPTAYPTQYCGAVDEDKPAVKERAKEMFGDVNDVELVLLYDLFMDTSIVQVNEGCIEATHIMTGVCTSVVQRKLAIQTCHKILDSTPHTKCVLKYSCNQIDIFVNCLKFVCNNYEDDQACEQVGAAIDSCRNFPILTDKVKDKNCYKDLLTAEDNPLFDPSNEDSD